MTEELATATYLVSEPFEPAVKSLRKALGEENLEVAGELDVSSRIRQRLLIGTAPCRVFFVGTSEAFEELGSDSWAAALTPMHVVVAARGLQTEIHILRALPASKVSSDKTAMEAFRRLQTRIAQAVERIGMRSMRGT